MERRICGGWGKTGTRAGVGGSIGGWAPAWQETRSACCWGRGTELFCKGSILLTENRLSPSVNTAAGEREVKGCTSKQAGELGLSGGLGKLVSS